MSSSSSDDRHFPNRFPSFSNENAREFFEFSSSQSELPTAAVRLSQDFHDQLVRVFDQLFVQWESDIDAYRTDDTTVYTGNGGYAVLYHRAFQVLHKTEFLDRARTITDNIVAGGLQHKDRTFLCGVGGAIALKAAISHLVNDETVRNASILKLLELKKSVVQSRSIPDELLYGRAGYLYCLLFVRAHCGANPPLDEAIEEVKNAIIDSGVNARGSFPLTYAWHDKEYLGAAHGWAGILFQLMRTPNFDRDERSKQLVKSTLDELMKLAFRSGNFPSSIGSDSDRLVHWCHGAPGFIHTLLQAHKTFNDERYLHAARKCADVIWQRGLLKKGYGLCHGVAGNAYALLAMWKETGEPEYLYQVCMFAQWMFDYGNHGCRVADRPLSLFEGLAGALHFLLDLRNPQGAAFPCFY